MSEVTSWIKCPQCSTRTRAWLVPGPEWALHLAWHPLVEAYNDAAEAYDAEPTEHGQRAVEMAWLALNEWVDANDLARRPEYDLRF